MIRSAQLIVGLEIHVELSTVTKMFSRALNPAGSFMADVEPEPNSLIDPVVLALPGALPVMNRRAVELSVLVGRALNCAVSPVSVWDRKNYFYPDMPKAYQISQYDLPLCVNGFLDLPAVDDAGFPDFSKPSKRIRIRRAHLEEDAGKLMHEAPGGHRIDHSIVDLNRAGTPLLEIVTEPDFTDADDVVLFARSLRSICMFLRATQGVMQKGHMRFEPNINCRLELDDGSIIHTPIVEIKNLNSFKSLRAAIEYEFAQQPHRYLEDRRVMGKRMKVTRGWDDRRNVTFVQREKEDADDYRYFPDPDLPAVHLEEADVRRITAGSPELPLDRLRRYSGRYSLAIKEAAALVDDPDTSDFYERVISALVSRGMDDNRAGKIAANQLLGPLAKITNERSVAVTKLGASPEAVAAVAWMRENGKLSNQSVEAAMMIACDAGTIDPATAFDIMFERVKSAGLIIEVDLGALDAWIEQVIKANEKAVEDVRAGKLQAAGRLVGEVMKLAGGKADAKSVRDALLAKITSG
ncbi:MAG: Asp-tRNA(Asn)/Glu-tRNA(Gln) amidotransferase subunit GatB [Phycisphaerales bacterium]